MEVWTAAGTGSLSDVPEEVRKAEAMGYDGIGFNETKRDPFLGVTLAAEHSQGVALGTSVAIAFPRSPMITASMSRTLQQYSNGRLQLGLGPQVKAHNERRFSVPWVPPGPRLREYINSLRAIWDCWQNGTKLDFRGQHYSFTLMTPDFDPGPMDYPPPRIVISAVNPYMCRLAGEICDGVLLHPMCPPRYVEEVVLPNMEQGARKAGRALKDVGINGGGFIVTGADEEELQKNYEMTRRRLSFYASTRTYKPNLDVYGWGAVGDQLYEMSLAGRWNEMISVITDKVMDAFCVVGTYDDIAQKVQKRYGGWATSVTFPSPENDSAKEARVIQVIREIQGIGSEGSA